MAGRIVTWVLGVLLTLLYVYLVVAGVGNLIGLREMSALLGLTLNAVGWSWLLFGIVLPVIVFAVALVMGRARSAGLRLLLLATGVCVVAAVQLEVLHLVPQSTFFV